MALRYLELNRPQYVPTYTSINPEILSRTDQAIQQQGAQFQQRKRDVFDVAAGNVSQELSGLSSRDVQYGQELFERSRQNIRQIAEERGAREAMPFLEEEANRLQNELQPLRQAAQFKQQAIEQLNENENLPASIRQGILGKVGGKYDEQGNLIEVQADINQKDLAIGANWESISEYLQDFNSKARKANIEEGRFDQAGGGFSTQSPSGEINDYRRVVEMLSGDKLMMNNMKALMADTKMRDQLGLLAKLKLQQENPDVTVNEEGEIVTTEYVPKVNSQGQYVDEKNRAVGSFREAAVEKKQITYRNGALWQAVEQSKPFAERDAYYRVKYDTQKATGQKSASDDMSESNFYTSKISWKTPEMSANNYFQDLAKKADQFERDNELAEESIRQTVQEFYKTDERVRVGFENGVPHLKVGNDSYSKSQLIQDFDSRIQEAETTADKNIVRRQKQNMMNRLAILESNEAQANAIERQIKHVNNGVKNQLKDNEKISSYADLLNFGADGSMTIDTNKFERYLRNGKIKESGEKISEDEARIYEAQNLSQGEVKEVRKHIRGREGWGPSEETGFIVKRGEDIEFYSKDSGKIGETITRAKQLQQKRVDEIRDAGEHKNVIGVALNPENKTHEGIISTVGHQVISPQWADGSITNSKGDIITEDDFNSAQGDRFISTKVALINGKPVITGYAQNADGNPKEDLRQLKLQGNFAESIARDIYGPDYHNALSAESFRSFLPQLINEGQNVNLSSTVVNNLLGTDFSKDFNIKYKNTTDEYGESDSFRIYSNGKYLAEAKDPYEVVTALLTHYDESRE